MTATLDVLRVKPAVPAPLDPEFCPIALVSRAYARAVRATGHPVSLALALERSAGQRSVFRTQLAAPGCGLDGITHTLLERLAKFLLWQIGGWKLTVGGPPAMAQILATAYSKSGVRAFDVNLMETVFERPFVVDRAEPDQIPPSREIAVALGGHLDGCRIGFDLGASDYKLAAVRDGEAVFTTEIPWDPKNQPDPAWHYRRINEGLKLAAQHLPRVDAIGGSSAGIYIDNRVMVASLFRAVPASDFAAKVKPLFLNLREEWGVPLEVANDGDVTALAGAMSLKVSGVLGIAMGSSQAAGFLDPQGCITGWLNELAFAPVDLSPRAAVDEWSGDLGCGAQYFSQQAVARLLEPAGIHVEPGLGLPERLKALQALMDRQDARAARVYETLGVYLGYAAAQYADLYDYRHLLVLGRVTTGPGGDLIVRKAKDVLQTEFPELASRLSLHLPDEKSKRVGQAVAAASLPRIPATTAA